MQCDAVKVDPASIEGLNLLLLPALLQAGGAQGASIDGNFTQSTQESAASGTGDDRSFSRMVKALGLALFLYQLPILSLANRPMKRIEQIGTSGGVALGTRVETPGVGYLDR